MNKRTAFLTVIYPTSRNFLVDFFNSLENQTYKQFDIIVINDNYKYFKEIKKKYPNLSIIELQYSNTPAKNREYGINYVIDHKYDYLVFGDCDDYFSPNRVETSLDLLQSYDIVVNDISLFSDTRIYQKEYFSNRIKNNTEINLEFIKDKNIFGLSNTAISTKYIHKLCIPDNLIAVDWYIFTLFLLDNKRAIFTNESITFYRQHGNNTIGIKDLTKETIKKIIEVKLKHFSHFHKSYNIYAMESKKIEEAKKNSYSFKFKPNYFPIWWELAKDNVHES